MTAFTVSKPLNGVVYPPEDINADYVRRGVLGSQTLIDALRNAFAENSRNYAISSLERRMRYAELEDSTDRLALAFSRLGLKPLDRVVFQLPNTIELLQCLIACWKADLIPICTLAAHRKLEIEYLADLAEARAHIIVNNDPKFDFLTFARQTQAAVASLDHIIIASGPGAPEARTLDDLIGSVDADEASAFVAGLERDPWQVCTFQLSGGTTGVPKIIPRFSNEYLYQMRRCAAINELTAEDTLLLPTPILHNANMGVASIPLLLSGGEVLVQRTVSPKIFMQTLIKRRPTVMGVAGPLLDKFKELGFSRKLRLTPKGILGWALLRPLRLLISMNLAREAETNLGIKGTHIFGMTEGVIMLANLDDSAELRFNSVGYPISPHDQVRLLRPGTEQDVAEGEVGEVAIRGPYTIHGYYRAADRNAEAFTSDGFYRSGDLMRTREIDGKRCYVFEGRIKDVIDRGGEKINCEEVERIIRDHPAVSDVAVVAYPCPQMGERGCASLIIRPGMAAPSVAELGTYLEERGLAKFKWPERIECFDEFPTTKSGKLSKPLLREEVAHRVEGVKAA